MEANRKMMFPDLEPAYDIDEGNDIEDSEQASEGEPTKVTRKGSFPDLEPVYNAEGDNSDNSDKVKPTWIGRQAMRAAKDAASGLIGVAGDIESLLNTGSKYLMTNAFSQLSGMSKEEVENIIEQSGYGEQVLPTTRGTSEFLTKGIKDIGDYLGVDVDLSAQGPGERMTQSGAEFVGGLPLFGGGAKAILPMFGAGAGAQGAEELGFGALGQLGGAVAGHGSVSGVTGLTKGILKHGLKGGSEKVVQNVFGKFVKPEQIKKEVVEMGKEAGIDMPIPAIVDNNLLKWLYTRLQATSLSGEAIDSSIKNTTKKLINNITSIPENFGGVTSSSKEVLGSRVQDMSLNFLKESRADIRKQYEAYATFTKDVKVKAPNITKDVQKTIDELKNTLFEGTEKKDTIETLEKALSRIENSKQVQRPLTKTHIGDIKKTVSKISEQFDDPSILKEIETAIEKDYMAAFKKGKKPPISKAETLTFEELLSEENLKKVASTGSESAQIKAMKDFGKQIISDEKRASEIKHQGSEHIEKALDKIINKLDRPFATEKPGLKKVISKIKKDLKQTKYIPAKDVKINLDTAVNAIADINDKVDFKKVGGTNKLLLSLKDKLGKIVKNHGEVNPMSYSLYENAQKEFGALSKIFKDDRKVASLLHNPESKGLITMSETKEGFERLKKLLPNNEQGQMLLKDIQRTHLENMITDKLINPVTGETTLRKTANLLKNPDTRKNVKFILGDEQFAKLEQAQRLANSAADGLDKYLNVSKSGTTRDDVAILSVLAGTTIHGIATMNPVSIVAGIGGFFAPKYFANIMADPKTLEIIIDMAKANKAGNMKGVMTSTSEFIQAITRIATESGINVKDIASEYPELERPPTGD